MKLDVEQWEADWDDDNIDDEFSKQLRYKEIDERMDCVISSFRAELQKTSSK